jgi:hypothetical protein
MTKHYEQHYSCVMPWGFSMSDTVQFNVRYGTHGLHYFV